MNYTKLGNTGLEVSVAGLGCGGKSRLGLSFDLGEDNAVKVVKTALDHGVNFFDTAEAYGTETVLGMGLKDTKRDSIYISSKFQYKKWDSDEVAPKGALTKALDASLKRVGTDYFDVYMIHGLAANLFDITLDRFLPEMDRAVQEGKIRFKGVTEMFGSDTSHDMLKLAVDTDIFNVIMVGHNMMNYSAQQTILPTTMKKGIGTLDMFAVRTALSNPKRLSEIMTELVDGGHLSPDMFDKSNPLGFILESGEVKSIMEAAYRFCRHTEGMDLILTGTSSPAHLADNINSINAGPLSAELTQKIKTLFYNIDTVSAQ